MSAWDTDTSLEAATIEVARGLHSTALMIDNEGTLHQATIVDALFAIADAIRALAERPPA